MLINKILDSVCVAMQCKVEVTLVHPNVLVGETGTAVLADLALPKQSPLAPPICREQCCHM